MKEETTPVRLNKDLVKQVKKFVGNNGGSIKQALTHGAIWVMSKGAKEYLTKLKSHDKGRKG
jgi:hypothetical protein